MITSQRLLCDTAEKKCSNTGIAAASDNDKIESFCKRNKAVSDVLTFHELRNHRHFLTSQTRLCHFFCLVQHFSRAFLFLLQFCKCPTHGTKNVQDRELEAPKNQEKTQQNKTLTSSPSCVREQASTRARMLHSDPSKATT